ncbi:hypothetical protein Ddye_003248 [Dipteronia dyeriana]|uniref:DUF4378 domain-containing protein n=1 Tax=Dipteronia dyeriana TaxID=168575 RepID=A0AAE0CVA3_9ROSI|nr:hypothetical protein Ddye_003248 [Dipteronia dyeriana]
MAQLRKTFSIETRPVLMLKDYLRDDLSSCSSNGFKSFPRRQCCTTVRYLVDIDLKKRDSNTTTTKRLLHKSRSKAAASMTISATLQRASEAVINAVKLLPITSVQRRAKKALLPRSFSRKLLKRRFWTRKADHKREKEHVHSIIKPLKLFGEFLGEQQQQASDQNNLQFDPTKRVSRNNSWNESGFTFTDNTSLRSSSGHNSETSSENDAVEGQVHVHVQSSVSNKVGVSVGEDSINGSEENIKDWRNEEEKEQWSPVSVLDCPFEDDETDITSPFHQRLARMEGTKQKLMQMLRRFESLAILEPVNLEKRIASSESDNDDSIESPIQSSKENITDKKAEELLKQIRSTTSSNNILLSKADNLLSDFFKKMIEENQNDDLCMLKAAGDWIEGKSDQMVVGWEVEGGRKACLRDMETNVRWENVDEEKQEFGLALESEVLTCLVNELVIDLF